MRENYPPPWLEGIQGRFLPKLIESRSKVIRVIAGPGSGKTTGLKRMIQRLVLNRKIEACRIFVGTFTRVIANDLSDKLGAGIGKNLSISTIHSLAFRLLRENPEACQQYKLRFLLEFEQDTMLYDVGTVLSKSGNIYNRRRTLKRIQSDRANRQSLRDAKFWGEAGRWLRRHGGMLIGEIVPLATSALEAKDVPQGLFDYVIVDEYQDLTACEQQMVELLWSGDGALVVLGDDDQSIYAFRDNHPRGLKEFAERWPKNIREDVPLPENHRSGKTIVQIGNIMMAAAGSAKQPMVSTKKDEGSVVFVHWSSIHEEVQGLANYIKSRPENKFLVLVPRRFIGYRLKRAIGTDARTIFYQQVLEHQLVQERFVAGSIIANPYDAVSARVWISFKAGSAEYGNKHNASAYSYITDETSSYGLALLRELSEGKVSIKGMGSTHIKNRATSFIKLYESIPKGLEHQIRFLFDPELAQVIPDEEKKFYVEEDLRLLRDACLTHIQDNPTTSLTDLMEHLRYRIATRKSLIDDEIASRVRIMTLHSAKGLEADSIIVAGVADQIIPGLQYGTSSESEKQIEEQRRLLYVSLTRAKQELVVSWSRLISYDDAKNNKIRIDSTFRKRNGSLAVKLTRSGLLPDVSGVGIAKQMPGSAWVEELPIDDSPS